MYYYNSIDEIEEDVKKAIKDSGQTPEELGINTRAYASMIAQPAGGAYERYTIDYEMLYF